MLEIIKYSFFQNALIGGILISLISSVLGVFVIMRKEANISHSIANFLFLGIAISLLLSGNYYLYGFLFGIIGSFLVYFIEKTGSITKESTKEIISQAGLAGGIFTIGFLGNLTLDINNFLFGSILFVNKIDIYLLLILLIAMYLLLFFFGRNFLSITINEDIAKSRGLKVNFYNLGFLIFLSVFIGISIKIFGIMLIGAFLVIPANTAKILGKGVKQVFIFSNLLAIFSSIFGLFLSYFLGTSAGATIVLVLIVLFFLSLVFKKR